MKSKCIKEDDNREHAGKRKKWRLIVCSGKVSSLTVAPVGLCTYSTISWNLLYGARRHHSGWLEKEQGKREEKKRRVIKNNTEREVDGARGRYGSAGRMCLSTCFQGVSCIYAPPPPLLCTSVSFIARGGSTYVQRVSVWQVSWISFCSRVALPMRFKEGNIYPTNFQLKAHFLFLYTLIFNFLGGLKLYEHVIYFYDVRFKLNNHQNTIYYSSQIFRRQ